MYYLWSTKMNGWWSNSANYTSDLCDAHRDASSADTRLAESHIGHDCDALEGTHAPSLRQLPG